MSSASRGLFFFLTISKCHHQRDARDEILKYGILKSISFKQTYKLRFVIKYSK